MNGNQTTPNVGSLMPASTVDLSMFSGLHGLDPLARQNRVPSRSGRARLRTPLELQSKVLESLNEATSSAERMLNEALGRWQKLLEEMESTQTDLASARRVMESLRAHKESLFSEVQALRGLFHPVRSVPVELLAQIFGMVVHDRRYTAFRDAVTLSHVCRAWRSAAIGHSSLWTTIKMNIGLSHFNIMMFTKTIAMRVGSLPVSLWFVCTSEAGDGESHRRKLRTISDGLHVIRSLQVIAPPSRRSIYRDVVLCFRRHAHSIQELELLGVNDHHEGERNINLAHFFAAAGDQVPCIRNIILSGVGGFNAKLGHDLPTLTNLTLLGTVESIPLLYIVLRCPNLESLRIGNIEMDSTDLDEEDIELGDKVVRPIRQLSVDHGSVIEQVAYHIRMPRLQSLMVLATIEDLQFGYLPELEYIKMPDLDPADWAPLALAAPNVTKIATKGVEVLIDWAGTTNLTEPPFKKLETLELDLVAMHIDLDSFDDLVGKRCLPEEITEKLRDPDTAQIHTIEILSSTLRSPLMTKSWIESKYLKHARVVNSDETLRICWTRGY
ncbi:hypothetical protein FRC17_004113 [Serendipita sp. 399]|nr:hypothetical protein FRC17_004113 [Serendipita sp. 399]